MSHPYICKNNPRIARERYIKIHIYLIEKLERGGYTKPRRISSSIKKEKFSQPNDPL